jgi:hypothetical protein
MKKAPKSNPNNAKLTGPPKPSSSLLSELEEPLRTVLGTIAFENSRGNSGTTPAVKPNPKLKLSSAMHKGEAYETARSHPTKGGSKGSKKSVRRGH